MDKRRQYAEAVQTLKNLLSDEEDAIAMMATISCELKHSFDTFSWVGFYRVVKPGLLKVGPYQGSHGCIDISLDREFAGNAPQREELKSFKTCKKIPYHIACSSETMSEIVVPIFDAEKALIAVS